MSPVTIRENEVEKFLRVNPDASIEALKLKFPAADAWDLREARRTFLRQQAAPASPSADAVAEQPAERGLSKMAKAIIGAGYLRPVSLTLRERPKVKPVFQKAALRVGVLSDLHAPDHDPQALDVAIQVFQAAGIDRLVLNGDTFDVHSLSKYTLAAHKPFRWVEERAQALPVVAMLREEFPDIQIDWLHGNHDVRVTNFITAQAPQLQGLFDIETLLGITDLGFTFHEQNRVVLNDRLLIKHGVKVAGEAGDSVKKEVRAHGMSVHMGHVHRLSFAGATRTAQAMHHDFPLFGVEGGCLCNLRPDYLAVEETANWQQGVTIYDCYDSGIVVPTLVPIHDGLAFYNGVRFVSRA